MSKPVAPECAARLAVAQNLPELEGLCGRLEFSIVDDLLTPFQVNAPEAVSLSSSALGGLPSTRLILRHAAEIALWHRVLESDTPESILLEGLLAIRTAGLYWRCLTEDERTECRSFLPPEFINGVAVFSGERAPPIDVVLTSIPDLPSLILLLGGFHLEDTATAVASNWAEIGTQFAKLEELAVPVEYLLVSGGDERLSIDPVEGKNTYGCAVRPRSELLALGSSTASTISAPAYQAIEKLRQELITAAASNDLPNAFETRLEDVKRAIIAACGIHGAAGPEVLVTASGTETELYALWLSLLQDSRVLVNIVIAPEETGSGVMATAAGKHFSSRSPLSENLEKGMCIPGFPFARVEVKSVPLRTADGSPRTEAQLATDMERLVEEAVGQDKRCLVHLLDCSKTGLGGPAPHLLKSLRSRYPDRVDIVVDACQWRVGPDALSAYVDAGFMVMVTGSKFLTGPSFSGALIVPELLADRARRGRSIPPGFSAYTSRAQWPVTWNHVRDQLPERRNLGLLCRWRAAIEEASRFESIPVAERKECVARLGECIRAEIQRSRFLRLVETEPLRRDPMGNAAPAWYELPTIFPFVMAREDESRVKRPLSFEEAKAVYRWLRADIRPFLPPTVDAVAKAVATVECQFGQPVRLSWNGRPSGALRICIDARMLARAASHAAYDGHVPFEAERRKVELAVAKVDLIMRYFDELTAAGREDPPHPLYYN